VERIAHRDLRNRSAEILRAVAAGESFEITNHGEVVAILAPPGTVPLRVKPATEHGGWADLPRYPAKESTQRILDELREDVR
jgi:antitoxin (DNA-binding transcriptional repressor) of toxin-antitoxin stability system